MRREGTDANNVQMSDVLCDFCRTAWTDDLPVIEGHQGSIVCGPCVAAAYTRIVLRSEPGAPPGYKCTMCLEHRDDRAWHSKARPEACICERCIDLAVTALEKDKDWSWKRPTA